MAQQQAVIFDLDGTLLDTLTDLATSGNEILARRGYPTHSTEAYRTFIGDGMANLVQRIFPKEARPADGEQTEQVLAEFRASYEDHWDDTTAIFPGVAELLNRLSEEGFPLGVLSNKAHDFTIKCVDKFLGEWQWDAVYGARDGVPRKPDPAAALEAAGEVNVAPQNCFFIGDSDVDMFTAKNAGMHAVGVAWGFRPVEELHSAGAEAVLAQPGDLLAMMKGYSK